MTRAFVILTVVARVAHAEPAPTFNIDLIGKDKLADAIAQKLAATLRETGTVKSARYRTKGTRADVIKAHTGDCFVTELPCAASIGSNLGVDYMIAGDIEQRGKRVTLTLSVVNVSTGKRVRSLRDLEPSSIDVHKWARLVWARVIDDAVGELAVSCNAERGKIFVDGQPAGELFQRRAVIGGLALGTHAIEIHADGYKPYADNVELDGTTQVSILLVPAT